MSRRGAGRWWRPTTTRRPAQRARQRKMFTEKELDATFDTGYSCGEIAERKRHERLEGGLRRLMDAIRESENGDPGPLEELAQQAAADDLMDVANAAGVEPIGSIVDPEQFVDELERWLREQDGGA